MKHRKLLLTACTLVVAAACCWSAYFIVSAYTVEREPVQLRLSGVDLDFELSSIEPSPFGITKAPDTRRLPVALAYVDEEKTNDTQIAVSGGTSKLEGHVIGPKTTQKKVASNPRDENAFSIEETVEEGQPIAGARVQLERHTSEGSGTLEVVTNADGYWKANDLLGGRYRVRAWVPNELATLEPSVIFIPEQSRNDEEAQTLLEKQASGEIRREDVGFAHTLDFELQKVDPQPQLELLDAGPIYRGLSGTVAVHLVQRVVDAEGVIVTQPVSGASVTMSASSLVSLDSRTAKRTDAGGVAYYGVKCNGTGQPTAVVSSGEIKKRVNLPACIAVPPPPEPKPVPETGETASTDESSATSASTAKKTTSSQSQTTESKTTKAQTTKTNKGSADA